MNKNQELHELLGRCWHEYENAKPKWLADNCLKCGKLYRDERDQNPDDAADPRLVLEAMREKGILGAFCDYLEMHGDFPYDEIIHESFSLVLDRTGRLRDLAIEFLKEQEGK